MIIEIDETEISNIIPSYQISLEFPDYALEQCEDGKCGYGLAFKNDIDVILKLGKSIQAQSIFEFGTWLGKTTRILALNFEQIYTLDCPREYAIEHGLDNFGQLHEMPDLASIGYVCKEMDNVQQFIGDSANIDVIRNFRNTINKQVDLTFIDGRHTYEYVLSDTFTAIGITRHKGLLVWHDVKEDDSINVLRALSILPFDVFHVKDTWIGFCINGAI